MTLVNIVGSWAKLHVLRIVAAVAVLEVVTNTAFLAANTRLKQYPVAHLRKRYPFIDNITKHFTDNRSGVGEDINYTSDSSNFTGIADELDTVAAVRDNARLERLYQILAKHHVIDTDEKKNQHGGYANGDGIPRNHTMVGRDNGKVGHDTVSGDHGSYHHTGKSALLDYKVLPNHNVRRRQISFMEMMENNETANMIHEFDTDVEMKAFVESDKKFPYDFVRLQQSGKYRLISVLDAKENARKVFAATRRRFVAGHVTLVDDGESAIMAGEVVWDANTGKIIVYGKSGHYRPSSLVGIRQVGRNFRSYFSNEH
jgi:hypothetical protein